MYDCRDERCCWLDSFQRSRQIILAGPSALGPVASIRPEATHRDSLYVIASARSGAFSRWLRHAGDVSALA